MGSCRCEQDPRYCIGKAQDRSNNGQDEQAQQVHEKLSALSNESITHQWAACDGFDPQWLPGDAGNESIAHQWTACDGFEPQWLLGNAAMEPRHFLNLANTLTQDFGAPSTELDGAKLRHSLLKTAEPSALQTTQADTCHQTLHMYPRIAKIVLHLDNSPPSSTP
eukprot:4136748-Amphidinium_carterae.1